MNIATAMTAGNARLAAQSHFRTLRLGTPFQPRIDALAKTDDWYNWTGYRAPHSLWDEELEYFAIRSQCALFDLSPMTKYRIEGSDAEAFCNKVTLRDVTKLKAGRVHYTAWCDDEGFVLDDGTLFRLSQTCFRLCAQERHLPWLLDSAIGFDVTVEEETEAVAGLALQGPTAFACLRAAGFAGVERLKVFDLADFPHEGGQVTISRTGFTGDLGYELFVTRELALSLWDRIVPTFRVRPAGPSKKTSDADPLAPVSPMHAVTGEPCPATGEWECTDHGSVQRRHIRMGQPVELTTFEYRILEHLMLKAGEVISKTDLTEQLYEQDYDRDSNVIEVFIGRLRRKLDPDERIRPIETLRGRGYRFVLPRNAG